MIDRSKNRSDRYQNLFAELSCAPETLAEYSDSQGLTGQNHTVKSQEELLDLKDQLIKAFGRIVDTQLTSRQKEVLKLCAQGLTQIEIAKKLNVNQSSITKSINGNTDYRNGKRIYGGARKKICRIAAKDVEIQSIFRRMAEINSEVY